MVSDNWDDVIGDSSNIGQLKLSGSMTKKLAAECKNLVKNPVEYYQKIMEFFYVRFTNIFDLHEYDIIVPWISRWVMGYD